ncbi:lipid II flippase MurJ [Flavobacterium sp. 3-210]
MKKNTSLLFLLRIIKLLIGIVNLSLTAKYFGVSVEKDVWLLAISVILFLDTALWGPVNETFRSKFIFLRGEVGEVKALDSTKSLLFFTFIISFFLILIVCCFPKFFANIIAPNFSVGQSEKLAKMIFVAAPILLITQLTALGTSILNAYDSFFIPEIAGFASAILNLFLLIVLVPHIGIYSLVVSYYVGIVILLVLLILQINKLKIPIFKDYNKVRFNDFKIFFLFALPFFFPYFCGQISAIIEKTLVASIGEGNVSALDYSRKFTDILTSVVTSVLVTMLVPVLSSKFIEKNPKEFVLNFKQIFQLGIIFLSFVIALFSSSSRSIINIFFDKGKIPVDMLSQISNLTMFYSWSSFSIFIYLIFGMALLSSNQSKIYAFWGVIAQIFSVLLNFTLVKSVGIYIFPISLMISHLAVGLVMSLYFPFKDKRIIYILLKYIILIIFCAIFGTSINLFFDYRINDFMTVFINGVLMMSLILMLVILFNLEEKKQLEYLYIKFKKRCQGF